MAHRPAQLFALALVAFAPEVHAAEVFGFPIRVGLYGGWHATPDDFDVLGLRRLDRVPGPGPTFGLRLGWRIDPMFTVGLETGAVVTPVGDQSAWLLPTRATLDWRPLDALVTPLVGIGGGFIATTADGGDLDALFGVTGGFEVRLGDAATLRFEGGVMTTDGVDGLAWIPVATVGLDLLAWRERHTEAPIAPLPTKLPPRGCPIGVGVAECRDSDDDGHIDAFDRCPTAFAHRPDGCPDPDKDGVVGDRDACPEARGERSDHGCPLR